MGTCWLAVALWATTLLSVSTAAADEESGSSAPDATTVDSWQLQLGGRYGIELTSSTYKLWQGGLGGALGRTLDSGLYLGGSFDWYVGEEYTYFKDDASSPMVGGNYWQLMAQVGLDRSLGRHVLWRPKVGMGVAGLVVNNCYPLVGLDLTCQKTRQYTAAIVPAAELIYSNGILLSLEARYAFLFDTVTIRHVPIGAVSIGAQF